MSERLCVFLIKQDNALSRGHAGLQMHAASVHELRYARSRAAYVAECNGRRPTCSLSGVELKPSSEVLP